MIVVKRDGREVPYDKEKIKVAISKAFKEVEFEYCDEFLNTAVDEITDMLILENKDKVGIEDIQDRVEFFLMKYEPTVAKAYITYRYKQSIKKLVEALL